MSPSRNFRLRMSTACVTTLLAIAIALPVHAQPTSPWSLDFGTGIMSGRQSGVGYSGTGLGMSGQLSWQSRVHATSALLVGLNANGFMKIQGGSTCLLAPAYEARIQPGFRDCSLHFPNGGGVGILGGTERRIGSTRAATRLAVGPMLFVTGEKRGSLGLQSRIDLTFRTFSRSQLVLWTQSGLAPTPGHGNSLLFAIGAGFRARDFIDSMHGDRPGPRGDCCDQIPQKRLPVSIQGIGR